MFEQEDTELKKINYIWDKVCGKIDEKTLWKGKVLYFVGIKSED